jgi:D-alanyl-D-alanine carboxypeptidase
MYRRHRLGLAGWLLVICFTCTGFGPPFLTDGGYPPLRLGPDEVAALIRLAQPPVLTAAAALLVDVDSGQILYALRATDPLPPASTVKIMTALVVLQQANVDADVTVSATAAATPGSRMGLVAGETLTVRDLLYGLLVPSGNDAAVALAEHVAGSEAAFVALMNQTAAALGLTATRFATVHGMDQPGQTTSAADLATMTRAALAYPLFAHAVALAQAQVAGHALQNTNELLGNYPGTDGIKTGTTDAAGECLVASVTRQGHRLLAVALGSADRYSDVRAMLDYAAAGWRWRSTALPDNALAWTIGSDDQSYRLRTAEPFDLFLPGWQWRLAEPVRRLDSTAPLTGTLPVGELRWVLANQTLADVPLTVWQGP